MNKLWHSIINIILPPRCISCGTLLSEHNGLCADCFNKIQFVSKPMCARCGHPFMTGTEHFSSINQLCGNCLKEKRPLFIKRRFSFIYDDDSKNLILGFKFLDKTLYAEVLARLMYHAGADIWKQKPDLLMPVPIHRLRLLERRYNQSALLVKYLAKQTGIDADYMTLKRIRHTIPQVKLSGSARKNNLKHAFSISNIDAVRGHKIVLVDDVETTGSTLKECARVLKKAGAKEIYALTLARPMS